MSKQSLKKLANNASQRDEIVIDATNYMGVVASNPFHPDSLVSLLIDPQEITSTQLMGYGTLDNTRVPVVRLIYKNGLTEDVFDVWHHWS